MKLEELIELFPFKQPVLGELEDIEFSIDSIINLLYSIENGDIDPAAFFALSQYDSWKALKMRWQVINDSPIHSISSVMEYSPELVSAVATLCRHCDFSMLVHLTDNPESPVTIILLKVLGQSQGWEKCS